MHIFAVAICGLFSHMDQTRTLDKLPEIIVAIPLLPALLALFVCPLLVLGIVISGRLRGYSAVMALVAETVIEFVHFLALLPSVS